MSWGRGRGRYYGSTRHNFRNIINSNNKEWPPLGANIQAAIDDLPNPAGGTVYLPYAPDSNPLTITAPINIDRNICLEGLGPRLTVIYLADNSNCNMINYNLPAAYFPCHTMRISHIGLDGNIANQTSGNGIDTGAGTLPAHDWMMWDCFLINVKSLGLILRGTHDFHISHCMIETCGNAIIYIIGSACNGAIINNYLYGGLRAILIQDSLGGISITDNRISYIQNEAIYNVNHVTNLSIKGNKITDLSRAAAGTYPGIGLTNVDDSEIVANTIDSANQSYGIDMDAYCQRNRIDDNVIPNYTTARYRDLGSQNIINGQGKEAGGPTAASWHEGDIVHRTTDNTFWIKDTAGVMRQIA